MVCSFVERVSASQTMPDDVGRWKLASQYIHREIKEADEINLLDEEDMHVFGLRPMMDPLILVCCNSCKRPVKVSQYATHAEICKSSSSLVDGTTETNVISARKKPQKKEKKKLQISISTQVASVSKPERRALVNSVASNSHVGEQPPKKTSIPIRVKGNEFLNEAQEKNVKNFDSATSHPRPRKLNDQHLQTNGMLSIPAPLATKIFYSQRTQRLRNAISNMYYRSSSSTQHDNGLSNMQISDYCHENNIEDPHEKLGMPVPCMMDNTDPAKSPEVSSNESRKFLPLNVLDQSHVNNSLGPRKTLVGNLASNSLRHPYPFDES